MQTAPAWPPIDIERATPAGPVLVVGGAGYIGSHTVRLLERREVPVVVLDNLSTGHREALRSPLEVCELADRAAIAKVLAKHKPAAVVHFAAKCYVGESVTDPAKYYRENVVHTFHLLEEMRAAGIKDLVFSSSCATYGEPQRLPLVEDHPQLPISPYGKTKLHMEHMLADYARAYGMRYAALRYFNAAGAAQEGDLGEDHDPETHLIPLVLQVALGQRPEIAVFGDDYPTPDGTCIRDYVHVEDLARAHLAALLRLQQGHSPIQVNLGTGTGFTVKQVIETARKVTGRAIPLRVGPRRAGDPPELVCGGTLAFDLLGWKPQRAGLEEIVRDAWNFQSRHPGGWPRASGS
jgi:UDP-glucose 4-epimerase